MQKLIDKILEYVEPEDAITASSVLKTDCGMSSFDLVCLVQDLCEELGLDENTINVRACRTVGDLALQLGLN